MNIPFNWQNLGTKPLDIKAVNVDLKKVANMRNATWAVFSALLISTFNNTAWAFSIFEDKSNRGITTANVSAFAFESMIALLTHLQAKFIEKNARAIKRKYSKWYQRVWATYANAYTVGLILAWVVATLANLSHAVEFGGSLAIVNEWGFPRYVFAVAFGGILPTVSFFFSKVLSNTIDEVDEPEKPKMVKNEQNVLKNEKEHKTEQGGKNKKDILFAYLNEHPEMDKKVTEVSILLGIGKGYTSTGMKEWRESRKQ